MLLLNWDCCICLCIQDYPVSKTSQIQGGGAEGHGRFWADDGLGLCEQWGTLLLTAFGVPAANFRIEQWFVLKALILCFTWIWRKITLFYGSQLVSAQELLSEHSSDGFSASKPGLSFVKIIPSKACYTGTLSFPPHSIRDMQPSHLGAVAGAWSAEQEGQCCSQCSFLQPWLCLTQTPSTMCTFLWLGLHWNVHHWTFLQQPLWPHESSQEALPGQALHFKA